MNALPLTAGSGTSGAPGLLTKLARHYVEELLRICEEFSAVEYRNFMWGDPSPEDMANHRKSLEILLSACRIVYKQLLEPGSPAPDLAESVKFEIDRLEDSWEYFYNPMPEAEAEAILKEVFPDESGT